MGALVEYVTNHFNDNHNTDLGQTLMLFRYSQRTLAISPLVLQTLLHFTATSRSTGATADAKVKDTHSVG